MGPDPGESESKMVAPDAQGPAGTNFQLYGRRKNGKLSARRQKLVDELLPALALRVDDNVDDGLRQVAPWPPFPSVVPLWLEIGFGKGEHLALQAEENQGVGFIGAEPFENGVAALLSEVDSRRLSNVRIFPDDARALIAGLPVASVDRVFLLHPDPWPKTRHAGRRFINSENLDALARIMADGAEFRLQTDHMGYARWAMRIMANHSDFLWTAESRSDWYVRPLDWPETRYELKARQDGRGSVYLRFRRAPRSVA